MINWICKHYILVYVIIGIVIFILALYGLISDNGFSAKGY